MNNTFYCSFVSIHYIICECGDTFPTEEALKEHLENDHKPTTIERNEYQCSTCFKIFSSEKACLIHQHVHTRRAKRPQRDHSDLIQRKPYCAKNVVCEVCGKRYASNAALRYHQRIHTGERPYQCPMCPKTFTMPLFLQIHIRTHTGERPYECSVCPKAFSNKAALLRHDRVHSGVKPYECPQCGKFFTQSNSMKLHVKTVHLKMPAPYKSKSRRAKQAMKQGNQMNVAVEIEERAYQPEVGLEVEEREFLPEVKTEVQDPEHGDKDVYEVIYNGNKHLYRQVKTEAAEIPMYEEEVEQAEVLYEEVYEMEEM